MRKKSRCPVLGLAVLGIFMGGGVLPAQGTPPSRKPATRGRRVLPQVREARALEGRLKGLRGEKRRSVQIQAARAWAGAAEAQKDDPRRAAQARVREALLLGFAGEVKGAEEAWKRVLELDPGRLGARALVGLADLARREKKRGKALELYQEAVKRFPKGGAPVQEALVWAGKLHMQAGRMDKAREAFLQVARITTSARRMAYVYDLLVQAWLRQGDLDKAKDAFQEGKEALEALGRGDERKAKAAAKALEGMRSPGRIEKAMKAAGRKKEDPRAPEKVSKCP